MNRKKRLLLVLNTLITLALFLPYNLGSALNPTNTLLSTNNSSVSIEDPILLTINPGYYTLSELNLIIESNSTILKYFGLTSNEIRFYPKQEGDYKIILQNAGSTIEVANVKVNKKIYTLQTFYNETKIILDKEIYDLNEQVIISLNITGPDISAQIISEDSTYKYLGLPQNNITFFPKFPGFYEIRLVKGTEIIEKTEFLVIDSVNENRLIAKNSTIPLKNIFLKNQTASTVNDIFRIHDSKGRIKFTQARKLKSFQDNKEIIEIELDGKIKKISFHNLSAHTHRIGIEELPNDNLKINDKKPVSAYAIDPQILNFTNADVTATAQGTELYKCKEWSFLTQDCLGTWEKVMDLTPGQNYTFRLTQDDPGFAETGISTVNSKKPIYHQNETVEIYSAVLDNNGYLVEDANVSIIITSPDNNSYPQSINDSITQISKGIYKLSFNNTVNIGNYTIYVKAIAPGTNTSMFSHFAVKSFYEFDIIRQASLSIDPWKGPFATTISITPYINTTNITLIEKIPSNLTITDAGGGQVIDLGYEKQIVWSSIPPVASVSYDLLAPLKTPELYTLGPALIRYSINAQSQVFWEARPWYIAIDPDVSNNATTCDEMQNRNNDNEYTRVCGNLNNVLSDDGTTESATAGRNDWCGFQTTHDQTLPGCISVDSVFVCAEWWFTGTVQTCQGIDVSSTGTGGTFFNAAAWCPTSANPGINCYNVTALGSLSWDCNTFQSSNAAVRMHLQNVNSPNQACLLDYVYFNISYSLDTTGPTFSNQTTNVTNPKMNQSVMFNITLIDVSNVSSWVFSWNLTGSWQNVSSSSASGSPVIATTNVDVDAVKGTGICYKWYGNDTSNNWGNSSNYCFTVGNTLPTQSTPLLVSSMGLNKTDEILYCYNQSTNDVDLDNIKNIYNWYINGSTFEQLNMPFEGGSNSTYAKDYSANSYDGSVNGATWNITGGYDGFGSYNFDGNDYISVSGDLNQWLGGTASLSFWLKTTMTGSDTMWLAPGITGIEQAGGGNDIFWGWIDASGDLGFTAGNGAAIKTISAINDGSFHHVVITRNSTTGYVEIYVDGVLNNTGSSTSGTMTNSFYSIGRIEDTGGTPEYFFGIIDDVRVYDKIISSDLISIIYSSNSYSIPSLETEVNDTWACSVTPNDLVGDGSTLDSSNMTILEASALTIFLEYPINDYVTSSQEIVFYYNVTGNGPLDRCDLIINGTSVVNTTVGLSKGIILNLSYNFSTDSTYLWWINCTSGSDIIASLESRNITINKNNSNPNVYQNFPPDNSTQYSESVTLNCTATDDGDISSITIYSNSSGTWGPEKTKSFPGYRQTNGTATHTLTGLSHGLNFIWNCYAIDYDNKKAWASSNFSTTIDLLVPNVTLDSPKDYWYDLDGDDIIMNCTGYDNADIVNISLYTNAFGSWQIYSTQNFIGPSNTTAQASFNLTGVGYTTTFQWNCLATDNQSYSSMAAKNYTLTIPPVGIPYFATANAFGGDFENSPGAATLPPDTSYASDRLKDNTEVYTYNYSGIPTIGTLLGTYYSLRWYLQTPPTNNVIALSYSNDSSATWYDLDGSAEDNSYDIVSTYPASPTNQSYLIIGSVLLSHLPNLYLKARGDGGSDNDWVYIDSIFVTLQHSPPPKFSDVIKNDSVVYVNETVQFNTTWTHDIGLGCYIFSINQTGTFQNSSCINMDGLSVKASITWLINATPGTLVEWYFWANDTFGEANQTPLQTFIVNDANDSIYPIVNSIRVYPGQAPSGTIFNITANITDNIGVLSALVEIAFPNGTKSNYSMTQIGNSAIWYYLFISTMGFNHSFRVFGTDGADNTNESAYAENFNVTSYITTPGIIYSHGETVNIVGYGFSPSQDVTLTIYDSTGAAAYGPINLTSYNNGTVSASWGVPSALTTPLGNYTINLNDTQNSILDATRDIIILLRPDQAYQLDDVYTTATLVTSYVDDSDSSATTINGVAPAGTIYLRSNFLGNIQGGYTLNGLRFYVEHTDLDPDSDDTLVEYYNGTGWSSASCSPIAFSSGNQIDICDLSTDISSIPDQDNISLRLNYASTTNDGVSLAYINFTGIWVNSTVSSTLTITIYAPVYTINVLDYSDEPGQDNHNAYGGGYQDSPPNVPPPDDIIKGTEATAGQYSAISFSDEGNVWESQTVTHNDYAYQSYYFTLSQSLLDITQLTFTYEGAFTIGASNSQDGFRVYIWDYNTAQYDLISANPIPGAPESTYSFILPTPYSDYQNATSLEMNLIVVGETKVDDRQPSQAIAKVKTDYVNLKVQTITTISGFQDINATAVDSDGIAGCDYHFTNSTGFDFSYYGMQEISLFKYYNVSDTMDYNDGLYNLTVNCSDTGAEADSAYITVKILNQPPSLFVYAPLNATNFTATRNVTFIWNASSEQDGNPTCDLYLDGTLNISSIISINGQNTSRTVNNFADGAHAWYLVCSMQGGGYNTSETRTFYVDMGPPSINLTDPSQNSYDSLSSLNFTYTPSDVSGLNYCELYIDDILTKTCGKGENDSQNWWDTSYESRILINITNPSAATVEQDYSMLITVDTTGPQFQNDGDDVRVVYWNGIANVEIDRFNESSFNNANTQIWFKIQADISPGSSDADYYLYFNNSAASNPPDNASEVFVFYDDFNRPDSGTVGNGWTETSGTWSILNNRVRNTLNGDSDLTRATTINNHSMRVIANHEAADADWKVNGRASAGYTYGYQNGAMQLSSGTHTSSGLGSSAFSPTQGNDYELELNMFGTNILAYRDDSLIFNVTDATHTSGTMLLHAWDVTQFDDVQIRKFVLPEPIFNLGSSEAYQKTEEANCTVINNDLNWFYVKGIAEGQHQWFINCTDIYDNTGNSSTRTFYIDLHDPVVINYNPQPAESFIGSLIEFNFTVTDNMATNLLCNITVDGIVVSPNLPAVNGTPTQDSVEIGDGFKLWNVTCWDTSGRTNTSETWNFTVEGDPTVNLISPDGAWINESNVTFTYYVEDSNGLANCSLFIDGTFNKTNSTPIINVSNNNISQVFSVEKNYLWTVKCFDTTGASTKPADYNFTYDKTKPNVTLLYPDPFDAFLTGDITFNFSVKDNLDPSLTCNLTIDASPSTQNHDFSAANGSVTSILETGISTGTHYWTIICWDGAGNINESTERYFDVGDSPIPQLISPPDDGFSNENVTFVYFINDSSGIENCSLYINGAFNQTNQTPITNGANNNFTLFNLADQTFIWNVYCVDKDFLDAWATSNYTLTIDTTPPNISMNYPTDVIVPNTTVIFNFTVTDNNDSNPYCWLYIDGSLNDSFSVTSGGDTTKSVPGITSGDHNWSVTCRDNASNYKYSTLENFTVAIGPTVYLTTPADGSVDTDSNLELNYTVYEGDAVLANCSLIINGSVNTTQAAVDIPNINNGIPNNFSLPGVAEQILNWTVSCTDLNSNQKNATKRILHVDWTAPTVNLTYPGDGDTLGLSSIDFNFTAFDNVDDVLLCNMTFSNPAYNQINVSVINGVPKIQNINGFVAGTYFWNVTCTDGGQANISATYNFTISLVPIINLLYPPENDAVSSSSINFTYIPQSINGSFSYCRLIFDGADNEFVLNPANDEINGILNSSLPEGRHNWTIFCVDGSGKNNTAEEIRNITIDLTDPYVEGIYPDGQTLVNSSVLFNITASDNLAVNLTCNITVNGTVKYAGLIVENNSWANVTISGFTDGYFIWNATCADDSGRANSSLTKNFTIAESPRIVLGPPPDNDRSKNGTRTFFFTPTENSGNLSGCELIIGGLSNQTNTSAIINGSQANITTTLGYGNYSWTVNCTDPSGYEGSGSPVKHVIVDDLSPSINLSSPQNYDQFNYDDITFNWTPTDEFGINITCNLTINGQVNQSNISTTSGLLTSWTNYNMSFGNYNYSVTCWDDLNNTNTSPTWNFTVNSPDVYIDNSRLSFNNSNPVLGENITISAKIENIGGVDATGFIVEFWDGLPGIGTLIANNTETIPYSSNITSNATWIISAGYHTIWVVINPGDEEIELNYSNNNATINISLLLANITFPDNDTWIQDLTPPITFNLTDYTSGLINYTIYVDGAKNGQNGSVFDSVPTPLDISTLTEATHILIIQATDYLGRSKNSSPIYINVDNTSAIANFITQNQSWFNITSPIIYFNITDNLDTHLNYSFFVNTTLVNESSIDSNTKTNQTIGPYGEGVYNITIQTLDEAGNIANYTITIYIDLTEPQTILVFPDDNENFTTNTVILNMSVTDNMDSVLDCNITLDGVIVHNGTVSNGSYLNYTATNLLEGPHYWNATCIDEAGNRNFSKTRTFNVFVAPFVYQTSPPDNYWSNQAQNTFYFNVSDDTGIENCSIMIGGQVNATKLGVNITIDKINNITTTLGEGVYNWSIICYDNTSLHISNTTDNRTINIDLTGPNPVIITKNESWFNTLTPNITFNLTDNMASSINYTFLINGTPNSSGQLPNPSIGASDLVDTTSDFSHEVILQAIDQAGNTVNSSPIIIFYDSQGPRVDLDQPPAGNITSNATVFFEFRVRDTLSPTVDCNLTIDGAVNKSFFNISTPGSTTNVTNITLSGFTPGIHFWNVTCIDLAGNTGADSEGVRNFTIPSPDVSINTGNITFSNSAPTESENITIYANIFNLGNTDAQNVIVSFFKGDPSLEGTQINGNRTIALLGAGSNQTVNVSWTTVMGTTGIFVVVDPPLSTNGTISEVNESNNKAGKNITVGGYHIVVGNTTSLLNVDNSIYNTLFSWIKLNGTGDNLFVADYESSISWTTLQAIGRNTSEAIEFDDFAQIDAALSMANFSDSINKTYTAGGFVKAVRNFTVFQNNIVNVPIVNSTNNSNFVTGIIWDTDDGVPAYNGTQDLLFITEINKGKQGYNGIVDFEIKIPAALRQYKTANTVTVAFYAEIK